MGVNLDDEINEYAPSASKFDLNKEVQMLAGANNDDNFLQAGYHGFLANTGNMIHTAQDALSRAAKPSYMSDEEWDAQQTGLVKNISEFGRDLEKEHTRQYSPWSANRLTAGVSGTVPYMVALGVGTAAAAKSGSYKTIGDMANVAVRNAGVFGKYTPEIAKGAEIVAPAMTVGAIRTVPEAGMEWQGAYDGYIDDAKRDGTYVKGATEKKAEEVSNAVFRDNMALLGGTNLLETLAITTKLPMSKIKSAMTKIMSGAAMNAGEEMAQQIFPKAETGKNWSLTDDDVLESGVIGAITGAGMQGAGVAMDHYLGNSNDNANDEQETGDIPTNLNDAQSQAWGEAQWVSEQTGVPAEFVYRQWAHESGNFTSQLAKENNNFGGLTQAEANGEENKQPDGGNYYKQYGDMHEYAQDYIKSFLRHYDGVGNVKSLEEFAQVLKDNGYYGDSVENYINGLKGIEAPTGKGVRKDYANNSSSSKINADFGGAEFAQQEKELLNQLVNEKIEIAVQKQDVDEWSFLTENENNKDAILEKYPDIAERLKKQQENPVNQQGSDNTKDDTLHHSDLLDTMNMRDYNALGGALQSGDIIAQAVGGKYDFVAKTPAGEAIVKKMDTAHKKAQRDQKKTKANIDTFNQYVGLAEKNNMRFDTEIMKLGRAGNKAALDRASSIFKNMGINIRKAIMDDVIAAIPQQQIQPKPRSIEANTTQNKNSQGESIIDRAIAYYERANNPAEKRLLEYLVDRNDIKGLQVAFPSLLGEQRTVGSFAAPRTAPIMEPGKRENISSLTNVLNGIAAQKFDNAEVGLGNVPQKIKSFQPANPQTQQRINRLIRQETSQIINPFESDPTAMQAMQDTKAQPAQIKSGALKTAEDKVMENAYRSAVNRGDYMKAIELSEQMNNPGTADVLRNYAKFSFSDKHNRDRERMRAAEKAAQEFIPEGYKGTASGVVEGLAEHEVQSITGDVNELLNKGLSLEQIEKEYKLLYNKIKANKSNGMSNEDKVRYLSFLQGAMSYVSEQRGNGQIFQPERENGSSVIERGKRAILQGSDRSGDDGRRLQGTDNQINQDKHPNQGTFSMPDDKIKFSFSDKHSRDRERMRTIEKATNEFVPERYKGTASGIVEGMAEHEIQSAKEYLQARLKQGETLEYIEKRLKVRYNEFKANKSNGMSNKDKIRYLSFLQGVMKYVSEQRRNERFHSENGANGQRHNERGITSGDERVRSGGSQRTGIAANDGIAGDNQINQDKHSDKWGAFSMPETKYSYAGQNSPTHEDTVLKMRELADEEIVHMVKATTGTKIVMVPKGEKVLHRLQRIADFGKMMGSSVRYFDGVSNLRGFHAAGVTYINRRSEIPHNWVFWHESFHWMRNNNEKLYQDIVSYLKNTDAFSKDKIDAYKEELGRPELSDMEVMEEMLADAMPEVSKRVGLMKQLAKENPSLAEKIVAWIRDTMERFHEFFTTPEHGLSLRNKKVMVEAFTNLARDMVDAKGSRIFTLVQGRKIMLARNGKPVSTALEFIPAYSVKGTQRSWQEGVSKETLDKIVEVRNKLNDHLLKHGETININTPERQTLRGKIANELYGDGAKRKNSEIYIVIGPPAAGKSSVAEPLAERTGSLIIDSDMAKERLPEFNNGKLAGAVHEESDSIMKSVLKQAMRERDNIILPVVGRTYDGLVKKVTQFKDNGYKVHIIHVDLPINKAAQRAVTRFEETGRFVDPNYVSFIGYSTRENYDKIKNIEGVVGYEAYSNDVARGERPICLESVQEIRGERRQTLYGNDGRTQTGKGTKTEEAGLNHPDKQGGFSMSFDNGKLQTETESFKKWFGDSKIIDYKGNPLVVYHGTENVKRIDIFDSSKGKKEKGYQSKINLHFFSEDSNFASCYANEKGYSVDDYFENNFKTEEPNIKELQTKKRSWYKPTQIEEDPETLNTKSIGKSGGKVYPVYLKIEKLFNDMTNEELERYQKYLTEKRGYSVDEAEDIAQNVYDSKFYEYRENDDFVSWLKENNYDGFVVYEGYSGPNNYIVFSPSQIKSATANNGEFNINNPDIRYSYRSQAEHQSFIKRLMQSFTTSKGQELKRKAVKDALEDLVQMKISAGHMDSDLLSIIDETQGIIRSRHSYDWGNILPHVGSVVAKRLKLNNTNRAAENYISRWLMDGALSEENSQVAQNFKQAMRTDPEFADKLTDIRNMFDEMSKRTGDIQMQSTISTDKETTLIDTIKDYQKRIYDEYIEEFGPIERMVKQVEKKIGKPLSFGTNPYIAFRMWRGRFGKAIAMIEGTHQGAIRALQTHYPNVNFDNLKTINMILSNIGANKDKSILSKFGTYCLAKHARDIHEHNEKGEEQITMPPEWSIDNCNYSISKYEKEYPAFIQAQKDLVNFSNITMQIMRDAGLLSNKQYHERTNKWKNHVPLFREFEDNENISFGDSTKRLYGSTKDIIHPIESIIHNTYKFIDMAAKNKAKNTLRMLCQINDTGDFLSEVESNNPNDKTCFSVMIDGQKKWFQTDPAIVAAINNIRPEQVSMFWKMISFPVKLLRAGSTFMSPEFVLRNPFRDYVDALVYSKHGFIKPTDLIHGFVSAIKADDLYWEFQVNGGAQAAAVAVDRNYSQFTINKMMQKNNKTDVLKPWKWLDYIQAISEFSEYATRLSYFKKTQEGLSKVNPAINKSLCLQEAAFEARDLMDFARGGKSSRKWNQWAIFANASLQGWDKTFRTFNFKDPNNRKQAIAAMARIGMYTLLPTLAFWFWNRDDDRYKNLPHWVKDTHYTFSVGDNTFRIPKGQDAMNIILSGELERFLNYAYTKDPKALDKKLEPIKQLLPGLLPTMAMPIIEAMSNYSFFKEGSIVPQYQQKLTPKMQYSPYTTAIGKWLGEKLDIAPRKIDHVLFGYTGSLGRLATGAYDTVSGNKQLNLSMEELPLIRGLMLSPYKHSKYVNDYYEERIKQENLYNEMQATGKRPGGFDPRLYARFKSSSHAMQRLSKLERLLVNNEKMPIEEKKKKQDELQQRRIEIVKKVMGVK